MSKEVIVLKDSLSLAVLQQAIEREKRLLNLSVAQIEAKLASLEAKFGTRDRKSLFGKVDDMTLVEWEGEWETLARLRPRLQRLEEFQVESQ